MALDELTRYPERGSKDRRKLDALLDEQKWGTLATVSQQGEPWVVPIHFVRDGDELLFHGSTGSGALRRLAEGAPGALCVAALDGVVVAETAFACSANYRSAVVRGVCHRIEGEQKRRGLDVLSNGLIPGLMDDVRAHTDKEMAATLLLGLPIRADGWIYKERTKRAGETEI